MRSFSLLLISSLMSVTTLWAQPVSSERDPIAFESMMHEDVREGYVTLRWNRLADAVEYEVIDGQEKSIYRGALTEAFISGLSDGEHSFRVRAFDDSNSIIATAEATTVVVQHWPLSYAITLFAIGFVVVTAVIAVIIRGAYAPATPTGDQG